MRTDVFTARPSRSQSFRDPPLKGPGGRSLIRRVDISGLSVIARFTCFFPRFFSLSVVSLWYRSHPVWDRETAARLPVVSARGSEPRPLLPRPPTALRCVRKCHLKIFLEEFSSQHSQTLSSVPHKPPCCCKCLLQHQMRIHPLLKIVPKKHNVPSACVTFAKNYSAQVFQEIIQPFFFFVQVLLAQVFSRDLKIACKTMPAVPFKQLSSISGKSFGKVLLIELIDFIWLNWNMVHDNQKSKVWFLKNS